SRSRADSRSVARTVGVWVRYVAEMGRIILERRAAEASYCPESLGTECRNGGLDRYPVAKRGFQRALWPQCHVRDLPGVPCLYAVPWDGICHRYAGHECAHNDHSVETNGLGPRFFGSGPAPVDCHLLDDDSGAGGGG